MYLKMHLVKSFSLKFNVDPNNPLQSSGGYRTQFENPCYKPLYVHYGPQCFKNDVYILYKYKFT